MDGINTLTNTETKLKLNSSPNWLYTQTIDQAIVIIIYSHFKKKLNTR